MFNKNPQPKHFNWKYVIRINLVCLRALGMWPEGKAGYTLTTYTFYSLLMNLFVEGHNIFQAAYISLIYQDLQALVAIFFVLVTDWNAALKIYFFVRNVRLLQHLMADLDTEEFQPKSSHQADLLKPTLNFWYRMYKMYWVITITDLFLLSAFPIIDGSYKQHRLPFWAWYPYNVTSSPLYEATYFYQVYSTWFLALGNLNMDSMTGALMMYIAAQCDLLSDNLKNLSNDDGKFNERLVLYIKHHKKIISFSNTANQFFNELTLGQFFTTCASMALAMFQLTVVGPTSSEGFSLLFYVVAMIVQNFFYCWFGNEAELRDTPSTPPVVYVFTSGVEGRL
ncbi:hypothetical protein Zmor_007644 [Zophobas morio]|uniref:Odorant receptor n=1 Tax=Zophobas morio TaxID=2755281 RepID=A0AA38IXQ6_9CUCU|nr:hypothetical protein Zmor_007644 [Zophobas morio]